MNASSCQVFLRMLKLLPFRAVFPAGLASLAASFCGILLMGASAWLIAAAAYHPPLYTLAVGITLVRACGLGRAVFRYLERLLSHRAVFSMLTDLRLFLYGRAVKLLPLREGEIREGELLHDLGTGCDVMRDFYLRVVAPPFYSFLLTLPVILLLRPLAGENGLFLLAAWGLCFFPSLWGGGLPERRVHRAEAEYRDSLLEWQSGWKELTAAGKPEHARRHLDREARRLMELGGKEQEREHLLELMGKLVQGIAFLWLLYLLLPCVQTGRMTGVDFAVWMLVLLSLLESYGSLPAAGRAGRRTFSVAKRVLGEATSEKLPEIVSRAEKGTAPELRGEGLSFSYRPGLPVFRDLDLFLSSGSHTAVVGESGTGKTTLLYLLLGLWQPDAGKVLLGGRKLTEFSREELSDYLAAATADNYIFNQSIRENFRLLYPEAGEEQIWKSLRICQMEEYVRNLPMKLDTVLGEDGRRLSGGERKRLQLALAMVRDTPVLLMDEPTANLNRALSQSLMEAVLSHCRGRSLLIITHDLPLAERMDRIFRLDK